MTRLLLAPLVVLLSGLAHASGSPVPDFVMWLIVYWWVVVAAVLICGGYLLWLIFKLIRRHWK